MRTRCALYARYSSDNQREASIEDQLRICTARAEREGWTVVAAFSDAANSGATTLRPGYQDLLDAMRSGKIDIVLTESLDRLSRDLEHVAAFHKQAQFSRVAIVTLSEGEISDLHVGLIGTMGALYLKDLAAKTHRGQEGRVRKGHGFGRVPYGYRLIRRLGADGEPERGLREIDPVEAATVRRMFEAYAEGRSPRAIAQALNAGGTVGPAGTPWYDVTIRGRPGREDGILRNPIYVGRMRWNRHARVRDPVSGQRVYRAHVAEDIVEVAVPEMRIISDTLWCRVQERLAAEAAPRRDRDIPVFWDRRRPRHLLSGKVVCGDCGGGFSAMGKDYLGCLPARRGHGCRNTRWVRRPKLEAQVLEALATRLMQPHLVAAFCAALVTEWNRLNAEASAGTEAAKRDLQVVDRKLANLVEAIADGVRASGVQRKLEELEARRKDLLAALAEAPAAAPVLHLNLAQVYADRGATLRHAIDAGGGTEVLEAARALIDKVIVSPGEGPDDPPGIELIGQLMAILKAGGAFPVGDDATVTHRVTAMTSSSKKRWV
ncbi:recombinase family protein [Roseomonas sp. CAU 1739]|uniref:recombinase family protein n=1 Tax=Roseomonas sp. CAU 1739 TaxID=3140364 RepID=UPI00325C089C